MQIINDAFNFYVIKKNKIHIGKNVRVKGKIDYFGLKNRVKIGQDTIINSGKKYVPVGFDNRTSFWLQRKGKIIIGKHCGITNACLVSFSKIYIGDNVLLGAGVKIYDTDFHSLNYATRRNIDNDNDRKSLPIHIGNDVFIGAGTIVLKGSYIGDKSIIGAGSVVAGCIPNGEVWAGNPAVFIRKIRTF